MNFFNQIEISKLFRADYILSPNPGSSGLYIYLGIIYGLLFLTALLLWFLNKKAQELKREFVKKVITLFITTAILGIIFIFFRTQEIPYLSSRLMFLLLVVMFVIWSGFILFFRIAKMPKEIKKIKEREEFEKYIPKKGSKK